jgi:hypothetical protein
MTKKILAIHKKGKTVVNPETCPHDDVAIVKTGHNWIFAGAAEIDEYCFYQCLDCGWVSRDGETWAPKLPDYGDKDVPW